MSLWEYKIITSGKGGFATPALLEKFLNDLGRDEWEIVNFQAQPDNFLAFTGLARRSTQRDWTLEDAAAAAAKAEAEKLRAEFEAKFKAATAPAPVEERAADFLEEKVAPDDGFRKPIDTSHDDEPETEEEEKDEWEQLAAAGEDELPTFFDAIKPHMRRNQRGPGMSVGVDYLAKKWDQSEDDLKAALSECGFVVPEDEDAKTEYLEYDGDLYWLNVNRRGELWINTKEKPRAVFRPVKAQKVAVEEEPKSEKREARGQRTEERRKPEETGEKPEASQLGAEDAGQPLPDQGSEGAELAATGEPAGQSEIRNPKSEISPAELPMGLALLKKIRPHMRRNRRGPGGSGSASFLSRALKCSEADLKAAFASLGFPIPASSSEKPVYLEFGNEVWWLNADSRGGLWINGREKKPGEKLPAASSESAAPETGAVEPSASEGGAPQSPVLIGASEQPTPEPGAAAPSNAVPSSEPTPAPAGQEITTAAPAAASGAASAGAQPSLRPSNGATITEAAAPVASVVTGSAAAVTSGIPAAAPGGGEVVTAARAALKEGKSGSAAAKIEKVAEELGRAPDALAAELISAGLKVPEKPREKPVFIELGGEIFWLSRNAKGELWLNARPAKLAEPRAEDESESDGPAPDESDEADKKAARPRSRKKPDAEAGQPQV